MENINRETWLNLMIDKSVPLFDEAGFKISDIRDKLKVSCSFIQGSRGSKLKNAIGVHYNPSVSADGFHEMMIQPSISDSVQAVGVLIHEMVHSIQTHLYHDKNGFLNVKPHGKEFRKIAIAVGLQGKMTATTESPELKVIIQKWIDELGEYPHAKMTLNDSRKKQSTRLLKLECTHCGFICRASNGAINNFGVPTHCGEDMEIA
jgi:predicted SprT family Zn-dependent metalloprotease